MKIAKASPEEVDALLNLMRVLNSAEHGFPCQPDGTRLEDDPEYFEPENRDHLRKFYERVTACFADHPGGLTRTVGGFHLAMTNDVFDPAADTYEWHPSLVAAVQARRETAGELPSNPRELPAAPLRWTPAEREAIDRLKVEKDMNEAAIIRQALRHYQAEHERQMGRTVELGPVSKPTAPTEGSAVEWVKARLFAVERAGECEALGLSSALHLAEWCNEAQRQLIDARAQLAAAQAGPMDS
jgi:hypothetical protein